MKLNKTRGMLFIALLFMGMTIASAGNAQYKEKTMASKIAERAVTVEKQTADELEKDNEDYISFLKKNLKPEIAQKMIDKYITDKVEKLKKIPKEIKMQLIELGDGSPLFWPYTSEMLGGSQKDPINLIFYRTGSAWNVRYDMKNLLTGKWGDAIGWTQYTYIGTTSTGASWRKNDYQLQNGSYWGTRYHIRMFDGGVDTEWANKWSDANVHKEHWDWSKLDHVVDSYEQAENFVKNDFQGKSFAGSIWYTNLNNQGLGDNNGQASVIELLR